VPWERKECGGKNMKGGTHPEGGRVKGTNAGNATATGKWWKERKEAVLKRVNKLGKGEESLQALKREKKGGETGRQTLRGGDCKEKGETVKKK